MSSNTHDLVVIGAGPGGYVGAIKAAQLGMNVACIDPNDLLGGTCLRVGCIPSKAMLESSERYEETLHGLKSHGVKVSGVDLDLDTMLARKDKVVATMSKGVAFLFKKNKVTHYQGKAAFNADGSLTVTDAEGKQTVVTGDKIMIATGSKPATLPGVDLSMEGVDANDGALAYDAVPETLAVIGAGYIGLELGSVWRRLGSKVTVVEYLDRVLPGLDSQIAAEAHKAFKKQGLEFVLDSKVTGVQPQGKQLAVMIEGKDPVLADKVLVAVGRKPMTDGLNLEAIGVKTDQRGYVQVDHDFLTDAPNVYAVGDVIPTLMLAHVAEEEAIACVEKIAGQYGHVDYDTVPYVVYTHPEVAGCGKTEDQLKAEGTPFAKGEFPFQANGRAHALNEPHGKVKVLADKQTDRILGVHIIGPRAGDLIAELGAAMAFGASSEDVARACHAHPTLSEAVKEACMAVTGSPIHA